MSECWRLSYSFSSESGISNAIPDSDENEYENEYDNPNYVSHCEYRIPTQSTEYHSNIPEYWLIVGPGHGTLQG